MALSKSEWRRVLDSFVSIACAPKLSCVLRGVVVGVGNGGGDGFRDRGCCCRYCRCRCCELVDLSLSVGRWVGGLGRYPVYEGGNPRNIRGILLTKSLILQNPERRRTVAELRSTLVTPVVVGPRTKLPDLLNQFQSGRCHMALVTARQSDVELVQVGWLIRLCMRACVRARFLRCWVRFQNRNAT